MRRIKATHLSYLFAPDVAPAMEVERGERFTIETVDARGGRAMSPTDEYVLPPPPTLNRGNPLTGPVSLRGAMPGDTLVVSIDRIRLGSKGYWAVRQDMGLLKDLVKQPSADVVEVRRGNVYAAGVVLPARPMVGTIGVAPATGQIAAAHPGPHGGNMDCNDVTSGARVLLPVNAPGALLSLGDVHATMGDGEVTGGGVEISGEVTLSLGLIKRFRVRCPIVETRSAIVLIKDSPKLEDAMRSVVAEAAELVSERLGVSFEDGYRIASVTGDLQICQAAGLQINPVVRMRLPKNVSRIDSRKERSSPSSLGFIAPPLPGTHRHIGQSK